MLYVFFGTDTKKVADQAHKLVTGLLAKRPDAQVFSIEAGSYTEADLDPLIESSGLFVEKHLVVLKDLFDSAESRESIVPRLPALAASSNIFILTERTLLAAHKKELTKHAAQVEEHTEVDKKAREFNVFTLSDALMARNRRELWLRYVEARRAGIAPEQIQGTLHFAVKALIAAQTASSADEAGQKPGVYSRARRGASLYSRDELVGLSRSLITCYHEAHRGRYDLDVALERWCLR